MSAFLCDDQTFKTLGQFVKTALRDDRHARGLYVPSSDNENGGNYLSAEEVITILFTENERSVNYRYKQTDVQGFDAAALHLQSLNQPKSAYLPLVAQEIKCLEYQSCECDDYYGTLAYKVLTAVKNMLITQVAEGL